MTLIHLLGLRPPLAFVRLSTLSPSAETPIKRAIMFQRDRSYTGEANRIAVSSCMALTNSSTPCTSPFPPSSEEIAAAAIAADEERRLTKICQQASSRRTDDDIRFVCQQLQLFSFWQLWPAAVQRELAKVRPRSTRSIHLLTTQLYVIYFLAFFGCSTAPILSLTAVVISLR